MVWVMGLLGWWGVFCWGWVVVGVACEGWGVAWLWCGSVWVGACFFLGSGFEGFCF